MALARAQQPAVPSAGTYGGLFVVTLSTLMYEIALTRIFSVTMWYHFAFMAISIALFGLTLGALIVYLRPQYFPEDKLRERLWQLGLAFSVSIAVCFITQLTVPFVPRWNVVGVYSVTLTCILIAIPYTISGIIVCLCLTRFPTRVNRLYGADLVGAALGCVLLVILLSRLDGPSTIIAIAGIAAIGAMLFASSAGNTRAMWWALIAFFGLGGFAVLNGYLAERDNHLLRIKWAKEAADVDYPFERWNAFSRVTVYGDANAYQHPWGWGFSDTLPSEMRTNYLVMTIDGVAATPLNRYNGKEDETDFLRYDITNLAHYGRPNADVLVIGVGGGRDILSAIEFEQNSVTGVEINKQILETTNGDFGEFTGHLDQHPKVRMVNDEARSYLTRTDTDYDIIQISLIDTWAATGAGAYSLSENSLYTVEAWETFFDRLKPGGVLSVSRWYSIANGEPLETYRTAALAAEVLHRKGVEDPRQHILIYKGGDDYVASSATVLVSPEPFTDADIATYQGEASRLEFVPILTPSVAVNDNFAGLASPDGPGDTIASFDEDISAPTDNRPFFFQMASLKTFATGAVFDNEIIMKPMLVLAVLAFVVLALTAVCIVWPLLATTERSAHAGMGPFYTYFAGIGLGFLLIEISQLQRLTIFLGHPTYALTVVLFSVLLASGLGSMLSEVVVRANRTVTVLAPLALLLIAIVSFGFVTPMAIDAMEAETTPIRIATAVAILMPLGLVMGMPFPIGMRVVSGRKNPPTAFLWGINGATSVCASVFGMVIALLFGISAAFWVGSLCYLMALVSMAIITLRPLRLSLVDAPDLAPVVADTASAQYIDRDRV